MKISTWNINSVRLRLPGIKRLISEINPDVICLQETKVIDDLFPADEIEQMGYLHQAIRGEKSYNGVAILSRLPLKNIQKLNWCGKQDCRHISAELPKKIELNNFYIPSGGDIPDPKENDKFAHKLKFLKEMAKWSSGRQDAKAKRIAVGDFNVAPLETDVWSHKQLLKVVSHTPIEVDLMDKFQAKGPWVDSVREIIPPEEKLYSWWSYRSRDWTVNDRGRRLDHVWVTEVLRKTIKNAQVLRAARSWGKPSDHVPVTVEFDL